VPSASQIKALLKSHIDGNNEQFLSVAMQMAAHEAKQGHGKVALEIRELIDQAKKSLHAKKLTPIVRPRGEQSDLFTAGYTNLRLSDMVLSEQTREKLTRLIKEHRQISKIRSHGLAPRKKMLLIGPPGTGKTMTASVLAGELSLPLFVVRLDSLITKFMGETASKLRLIFDSITNTRGVYLFDEFDSIGAHRGMSNDVGEIRRILNSFLQLIEQDQSNSLLIAATNHPELLDQALYRRFDDIVEFTLPVDKEIVSALKNRLASYKTREISWAKVAAAAKGLSFGDLAAAADDAMRDAIIHDAAHVDSATLLKAICSRKTVHSHS